MRSESSSRGVIVPRTSWSCRNIYAEHRSEEADRRVLSADPDQFLDLFALFLVEGSIEAVFLFVVLVLAGHGVCVPAFFFFFRDTVQCILLFVVVEKGEKEH